MKSRSWVTIAAIAVLGYLAFQVYGCEQRDQGALKQQIKARETVIAALAKQKARVDTEYVAARTKMAKATTPQDSLLACVLTVETCERRVAVRDSIIGQQDTTIRLLKKRKTSRFGCAGPLAATSRGLGLGVACGIRF